LLCLKATSDQFATVQSTSTSMVTNASSQSCIAARKSDMR
jgi:hypothetical protein